MVDKAGGVLSQLEAVHRQPPNKPLEPTPLRVEQDRAFFGTWTETNAFLIYLCGAADARAFGGTYLRPRQVRDSDFAFVMSREAQAIVQEEGIILVDYRAVQALWNAKSPV